jgi:hypothetical protein
MPKQHEDHNDKAWSLTDCISLLVRSDQGLAKALLGVHYFKQAGFATPIGFD